MSDEREVNREIEARADRIARQLAVEDDNPELWELYIPEAYEIIYKGQEQETDE